MSINPSGGIDPQSTVEAQLRVLNSIDDQDVQQFVRKTLDSWHGRQVSTGEIDSAIDKATDLVSKVVTSQKPTQEIAQFSSALEILKTAKGKAGSIDAAAAQSLNMPRGTPQTVESVLKELDMSNLDEHPAYHEGWTKAVALKTLELPSVQSGSFVIVKEGEHLTMLIKRDSGAEQHPLEKLEDEPGYTVYNPSIYGSIGGSCSGIIGNSCSGLDTLASPPYDYNDSAPPAKPEVLSVAVTPLNGLKPEAEALLKLSGQLANIRFETYHSRDWAALMRDSDATKAPGNRPQYESPENNKKASVDEINLAQKTAKQLIRDGKPVFFHCNTVRAGNHEFDCHQLPTDYSKDDVWLSLWEDAGKGNGKATIMKLSTDKCPIRNDLPVIRDYWPVKEGDPSIAKFQERCAHAEKALKGIEKSRKVGRIKSRIAGLKRAKKATEAELSTLIQVSDSAGSSSKPIASSSSGETQADQLTKKIENFSHAIADQEKQLSTLLEASQEHLAYVTSEKEAAASGAGPGVYVGSLTTVDGIKVEHVVETPLEGFPGAIVRKFKLTKDGEDAPRFVTQIDYPAWEDFSSAGSGVLTSLRDVYKSEHGDNPTPMKVHCRAGVGRTGTFVSFCGAMDIIEDAARAGKINGLDGKEMLFGIIAGARSQRDFQMVQTQQQAQQVVLALESEVFKMAARIT